MGSSLVLSSLQFEIASDYLLSIRDFAFKKGISCAELLHEMNVDIKTLALPPERIDAFLMCGIGKNLVDNLEKPLRHAVEYASMMSESTHGMLMLAIQGSDNLLEGVNVLQKYIETRSNALSTVTKIEGDKFYLRILPAESLKPMAKNIDVSTAFFGLSLLINLYHIGLLLLQGNYVRGRALLNVNFPEPDYVHEIPTLNQLDLQFDKKYFELVVPVYWKLLPLGYGDPELRRVALDEIKVEFGRTSTNYLIDTIKGYLCKSGKPLPNLKEMAARLSISPSTLQRRLAAHKTSYSKLCIEFKVSKVKYLLEQSDLRMDEIASKVGFENTSNFSKFAKQHLGVTPYKYRLQHKL